MWRAATIVMLLAVVVAVVAWWIRDEPAAFPPSIAPVADVPKIPPRQEVATVTEEHAPSVAAASPEDAATPHAQLRWDGPATTRAGSLFNVALRMTSDVPVRVVPMQLHFDPEILELVSVTAGAYFGDGTHFGYNVNRPGSIRIGATADEPMQATDAELVTLTFRPIRPGARAEVHIYALELEASSGRVAYDRIMPFASAITR